MKRVVSCGFNMDTGCVEAMYEDSSMVAINCTAVENQITHNMYQRAELDWLIYNEPHTYVNLILSGEIETYLKNKPMHKIAD